MTRVGALALALAALAPACGPDVPPRPERVLVLVMDTTHASHLGCYGGPGGVSPHVDALAARGRRFAAAHSNATWTLPSTVSLFSGRLQESHGVVTNHHKAPAGLPLMPELFAAGGWRTAAFVEMVYASAVYGLERGFDDYHYYSMTAGAHPANMPNDVVAWIDEHHDENWLLYVHMRRPHSPYEPNPLVQRALAPDCPLADGREDGELSQADSRQGVALDPAQAAHVEHLYRANLASADRAVGRILDRLREAGGVLVVLTSDHGEALGQHGYWGHGYRLEAECIDVPLVVAGPGVAPGVDDAPACTVDVLPTLLELAGLPAPPGLDGRSLARRLTGAPPSAAERDRPVLLSTRYVEGKPPAQGVLAGRFKLVLAGDGAVTLFDLADDPGETRDAAAEHPELLARLLSLARARRDAAEGLAQRDTVEIAVREEELRALGYLR